MKKVVFNKCYGGFGLSRDAVLLLLLNGFELEATPLASTGWAVEEFSLSGPDGIRAHSDFAFLLKDGICYSADNVRRNIALRSHPVLIEVVESLGSRANGPYAELAIEELKAHDVYRIDDYDGLETVEVLGRYGYEYGFVHSHVVLTTPASAAFTEMPCLAAA